MEWLNLGAVAVGAYLIGSIPFGFLIARSRGIDIRQHGSGNIGATNVFRVVGKREGIIAFILDVLKGALPVLLALYAIRYGDREHWEAYGGMVATLATVLGHNYTPWLGFKGGKGIATSAGALAALMPLVLLGMLVTFYVVFKTSRMVSLGSIAGSVVMPVLIVLLSLMEAPMVRMLYLVLGIPLAALAVWRHRSNIRKILRGEEYKFSGEKRSNRLDTVVPRDTQGAQANADLDSAQASDPVKAAAPPDDAR